MTRAYLGLGSNLNEPKQQLARAIDAIAKISQTELQATSAFYSNPPMGPQDQPDYVNAVVAIETRLSPQQLLQRTAAIETAQGRLRQQHWGPRTIDIDILLYGDEVLETDSLTIPHPGLDQRCFVVVPLLEIAPNLRLPSGQALAELAANTPEQLVIVESTVNCL